MVFHPELCRNESEVESKFIVQYLLPKLGYTPDTWHQEVTFGNIRLDFLVFATQVTPFKLDGNSSLAVVMEAKHPKQNLNSHVRRLKRYLNSLSVRYGLLTNGKDIRIYEKRNSDVQLVFRCSGTTIESNFDKIHQLIGRNSLNSYSKGIRSQEDFPGLLKTRQYSSEIIQKQRSNTMKVIAVYHNKGGVGKTTTVVNLAAALRKKGHRILVIDLDSQANTTFATGLIRFEDEQFDDIKDSNILQVLQSEEFYSLEDVARKSEFTDPEIDVVPSHIDLMEHETELNSLDYSRLILIEKLENVKDKYDIVLIDTPPSLNLYARIAIIAADYLMIPSDLKPFANQGLINVKDFVKKIDGFRKQIRRDPIKIIGVLPCKISTNAKFVQHTFPKRRETIPQRYDLEVMESVIYDRDDLAKCTEQTRLFGNMEIAQPRSILDFKPDSIAAQEFELLGIEVLQKIGLK
ncbi:MAG: AAA family ATPase [Halothece sp.]